MTWIGIASWPAGASMMVRHVSSTRGPAGYIASLDAHGCFKQFCVIEPDRSVAP